MEVQHHKYCVEIKRENSFGDNINIQIQKDCSQIRIKDDYVSLYVNITRKDLELIRDSINETLTT